MLTPLDIQQKKFHTGIGFEKNDVTAFFEQVSESYEQIYRENASLKARVSTLEDGLQNYKLKESSIEKEMLKAQKDCEDIKAKAAKSAKNIELDAKNKAKVLLEESEARLEKIKQDIAVLETQYAAYKSNFISLMKMQYDFMGEKDFDAGAKIDPAAITLLGGRAGAAQYAEPEAAFGEFSGDPQMRDQSTLGGAANSGGGLGSGISTAQGDSMATSTAIFGSNLSANENFVDPFNPAAKPDGRYNPYDGAPENNEKKPKSNLTVNTGKKNTNYKKTGSGNAAKQNGVPTINTQAKR